MKLVQCVPNFSEGRRQNIIEELAQSVRKTNGVLLADYSADADHNRCVLTFLGTPESVRQAVLSAAEIAVNNIDISAHSGEHPRVGAVDVVPVVPILGCTIDECVRLSQDIAQDFAEKLSIPVYLYACSARHDHRKHLPKVRKGGLESLRKTGLVGERCPDYGPCFLHPTAGASIVGARGPLIAFNVNLQTSDPNPAQAIAAAIRRERSHDSRLSGVRAIGVSLSSIGQTQVSTNITKPGPSSLEDVYERIERGADAHGIKIAKAELIGCIRAEHLDIDFCRKTPNLNISEDRILDIWVEKYFRKQFK